MGCSTVSFHCRPHIRKYLLVTLAPGERLSDPGALDLLGRLGAMFGTVVLHALLDEQIVDAPRSLITLVSMHDLCGKPASARGLKKFNGYAEQLYNEHAHAWLDWYRSALPTRVRDAIEVWRSRYGITEEDQPMWTAEKAYLRYRLRDRKLKRGGARYGTRRVSR